MTGSGDSATRRLAAWRDICGIPVAVLTKPAALSLMERSLEREEHMPVAFLNANNANIAAQSPALKQAFDHFLTVSDGVGVDIASFILHGEKFPDNLNGTDLVPKLLCLVTRPLKVGLIGAKPEIAARALQSFQNLCPHHSFTLFADGYFTAQDEPRILAELAQARPDILLVAMGVPRQELWIQSRLTEKHCLLPIAVGALFDIFTGAVPRAPGWMIALRIEWIYRLWREPKRLWRRYIIGNPVFLGHVLKAKLTGASSDSGAPSGDSKAARP